MPGKSSPCFGQLAEQGMGSTAVRKMVDSQDPENECCTCAINFIFLI